MAMEKRLQDLIGAMRVASDVENLDSATPILMRKSNPAINKTVSIICSEVEPHQMVLPLNVVWFVFDKASPYYMTALKRTSKDQSTQFNHSWKPLYYYAEAMEAQYYDEEDQDSIGNSQRIPVATTEEFGIVKLFSNPPTGQDPVVVTSFDSRLTDARDPKDHTHAEIPAEILEHSTGQITIADGTPQAGFALVADSATAASWRRLTTNDVEPAIP